MACHSSNSGNVFQRRNFHHIEKKALCTVQNASPNQYRRQQKHRKSKTNMSSTISNNAVCLLSQNEWMDYSSSLDSGRLLAMASRKTASFSAALELGTAGTAGKGAGSSSDSIILWNSVESRSASQRVGSGVYIRSIAAPSMPSMTSLSFFSAFGFTFSVAPSLSFSDLMKRSSASYCRMIPLF